MHTQPQNTESKAFQLDAWEKHEKIAMHFNELILKIRIQALGAVAAIVTIGGVLLKTIPTSSTNAQTRWDLLAAVFAALLFFWIAICLLDFLYYNKLLMGAVDSLLGLEKDINSNKPIEFNMSHKIENAVLRKPLEHRAKGTLWGPGLFYAIVGSVLLAGLAFALFKTFHS